MEEEEGAALDEEEENGNGDEEEERQQNSRERNGRNFSNFAPNFAHAFRHFRMNPREFRHFFKICAVIFLLIPLLLFFIFYPNSSSTIENDALAQTLSSLSDEKYASYRQRVLRVMTFNIWISGANVENGIQKIANQIRAADPDIVALQEVRTAEVAKILTNLLGPNVWKCGHHPTAKKPDTVILTKHKFAPNNGFVHLQFVRNFSDFLFNEELFANKSIVTFAMGATIQLEPNGQLVSFYSLHLEYKSYGPYAANNKKVTRMEQIMAGERNKAGYGRAQNIEELLANSAFKKHLDLAKKQPLILAGDFNAPSHLDWIEATKNLHGGWVVEWPATKLLMDAGFEDSFRKIHPNVVKEPGITWSTIQKNVGPAWDWQIAEPQDRIDFIFYAPSAAIRPLNSFTFAGNSNLKPVPNHSKNEWPSDHFAVITEFQIADLVAKNNEKM